MLLFANKARSTLTTSVTSAAGQVATITTGDGGLFVGVGGVATSTTNPMRCVLTAVDANGNDTGAYEIVEVVRSGDNLTLQSRGLEGTTAAAWSAGAVIECRPSAGVQSRGPQLIARGIGRSTQALSSSIAGAAGPIAASVLPGGNPLVIPAGTLVAGDQIHLVATFGHRGTTTATNWESQLVLNSFYNINGSGSTTNYVATGAEWWITIVDPATIQTITGVEVAGGFATGPNVQMTFNLTTTALTIDIQAGFSAAPAADELVYLDRYVVTYTPAGMP